MLLDNKVKNGHFEDGLNDWTASENTVTTTASLVLDGARAHEMIGQSGNRQASQEVPVTANTSYYIQGWVKTTAAPSWPSGKHVRMMYTWYDSSNGQLGSTVTLGDVSAVQGYAKYWTTQTSPSGAAKLLIQFILDAGATDGKAYIDGVYVR